MPASPSSRCGAWWITMSPHEPDGTTTGTSSSPKTSMRCRAIARASSHEPELNAGWPQQVWFGGTSTVTPRRSSSATVENPTCG